MDVDTGADGLFSRPQSWSALDSLGSLSPLSPTPSGSLGAIATFASFGELPIFLHTSDDASPTDLNHAATEPASPGCPRVSAFLAPNCSTTTTFQSTNTFGVPRTPDANGGTSDYAGSDDASDYTARSSIAHVSPDPAYLSAVRPSRSAGYFSNRFASIADLSRFSVSAYAEPWGSNDNLAASTSGPSSPTVDIGPVVSPSGSIVVSPADDCLSVPTSPPPMYRVSPLPSADSLSGGPPSHLAPPAPSRSWSTISTVLFNRRPISPSLSMTSTLASADTSPTKSTFRFPHKSSGKPPRSPSAHSDLAEQAIRCLSPLFGKMLHSTPSSPEPPPPRFDRHPCPLLGRSTSAGPFSGSGSGSSSGSGHTRAPSTVSNLPEPLNWLRETCIELWIDQEGFRAIRAQFHLAAYTPAPPLFSSPADEPTYGLALFRPTRPQQQRAVYHHGALDSAPVLRRLTLAGSEERDYISRQASLTIKANGVYAVCGTEDAPGPGHAPLRWRFEYAVDDLRGEKALAPLSFACAPGLLHAGHGKRVRLMHVLKKNITPKLSAKRAAGDDLAAAVQGLPDLSNIPQGAPRTSLHRRTRSSDPSSAPTWLQGPTRKARPASVCAASALPPPSTSACSPGMGVRQRSRGHAHAHSVASSQLSAHIVSPDELAQILEGLPTPDRPRNDYTSHPTELSPPPSYYRNRRVQSEMERVDEVGALVL
ncbi:hypothetical protein TRAPUB_679 [Trametes pubescens]|uniref:Uncharacterized protein n=1 Tax=Trametes pubescens TaxID=154538 RepID=A0A1M2VLP9_TRAPU|nr:hypothetical protein TRAPUB_679 [Trametes pubescens]